MVQDPSPDTRPAGAGGRWAGTSETSLRRFSQTETAGAVALLAAAVAALVWANVAGGSYHRVWTTHLGLHVGGAGIDLTLAEWINTGLMALFFFVVGLEARRELDMGDLRERRRVVLPAVAGVGGMAAAVGLYLAWNAGRPGAGGWAVAMSTDTAFALGVLALVGPRFSERLRAFLLTVVVADDIVALLVITFGYTDHVSVVPLVVAAALFVVAAVVIRLRLPTGWPVAVVAVAIWVALSKSGVDPLVTGLAMGLLIYASPAVRVDLERATELFRGFREQPTPELARAAGRGVRAAVSPNERLQERFHPWTSFVVVPLFALSNAGLPVTGSVLATAFTSPVTLGIVVGYVVGKPVGVLGLSWLTARASGGRLRPPVGWLAVAGAGTLAGVGFTVSLLVATVAFSGLALEEAKIGILTAAVGSSLVTWAVFRVARLLHGPRRARLLLGTTDAVEDLAVPVDDDRDHVRGPAAAPITLVEYGDFECPYCGQAEPVVRELLADFGDLRYVWRHLPLRDVHPDAQLAAEASEAAARQGAFWPMHDQLLDHQGALAPGDLVGYARRLDLDVDRFVADLKAHAGADRVDDDVDSADLSGVAGTPSFFINGRRHHGAYDIGSLTRAIRLARAGAVASR
ncbi:MAG TPA: Na+/H+ antiporter NhaA [Acidimicrobiales bacterium]|nr:Na+/H+ antiporter NhaA [Acidimicrobiales bacterium]